MFEAGVFSSDPSDPRRADARALEALDEGRLADALQVSADNPLVGLDGRIALLRALGRTLKGERIGSLFDALRGRARRGTLEAPAILEQVLVALEDIWPRRTELDGANLGDTWPHPAAGGRGPSAGLVPLHKLSQWLVYSLVEPLEEAGLVVSGLDRLTGLAEYRGRTRWGVQDPPARARTPRSRLSWWNGGRSRWRSWTAWRRWWPRASASGQPSFP